MDKFEDSLKDFYHAESRKEKELVLLGMTRIAKTYYEWLFIFSFATWQNTHHKAEKQLVIMADNVSDLIFLIKNFRLSYEKEDFAIKKALRIANDEDFPELESICREKMVFGLFTKEKLRRSMQRLVG